MYLTSGDAFYAIIGAALAITFTGAGLSVANSRRVRRAGAIVFLLGLCGILSPMFGVTGMFHKFLHIG